MESKTFKITEDLSVVCVKYKAEDNEQLKPFKVDVSLSPAEDFEYSEVTSYSDESTRDCHYAEFDDRSALNFTRKAIKAIEGKPSPQRLLFAAKLFTYSMATQIDAGGADNEDERKVYELVRQYGLKQLVKSGFDASQLLSIQDCIKAAYAFQ